MQSSRNPSGLTFLILAFVALIGLSLHWHRQLPPQVASHFDLYGRPDGWMKSTGFTSTMLLAGLAMPSALIAIMMLLRRLPSRLLNVPNADYWRQPAHYAAACAYMLRSSFWLGGVYVLWVTALFHLVAKANTTTPVRLDSAKVWLLAGFLIIVCLIWVAILLRRFLRVEKPASSTQRI